MAQEIIHKRRKTNWLMWAVYAGVALAILLPLFKPGFVLTLDLVFTPVLRMPDHVTSSYLLHVLFHVLNFFIPSEIIEKATLFAIFLLSGIGMHRLVRYVGGKRHDKYQEVGAYFAGLFYTINPFTYDRFMAGQYNILLGYALIPFFVRALLAFLQKPVLRTALVAAAWTVLIGIVSLHTIGLIAVVSVVALTLALWKRHDQREYVQAIVKFGALGVIVFLIASSYWIVPLAFGKGTTATEITGFTAGDQQAFATAGDNALFKIGNIVRLQGFWAEAQDLYQLPQDGIPAWGMLALMLWVIVIIGGVQAWKSGGKFIVRLVLVSMLIAAIVTLGIFNSWLAAHVPLFAGYREPQKFVALVAFGYALLSAWGVGAIVRYVEEQADMGGALATAAVLLFLIPVVFTSKIIWGANGQLSASKYPGDWSAMNKQLDQLAGHGKTLFLPWHLYMYYDFAGRIIASPASAYFDKPVIVSANPEFQGASSTNETATQRQLDTILKNAGNHTTLGSQLAALHIKYILLAREDDTDDYKYLDKQSDLQLVTKDDTLELYRNNAYQGE